MTAERPPAVYHSPMPFDENRIRAAAIERRHAIDRRLVVEAFFARKGSDGLIHFEPLKT